MDATHFDRIAKLFAARRTRRQAITQAGTGLAAVGLAVAGLGTARALAAAQDATPPAVAEGEKTEFLFLQAFRSGSIAPKDGATGTYILTLEGGLGQTIAFSDRPERVVGASPTPRFLEGLGFLPDNPPNAALVVEGADGQTEVAVLELFNPSYDEATHTATYEVAALAEWEAALGVGFTETPADLAAVGDTFGAAHLFINDCADWTGCWDAFGRRIGDLPGGQVGTCWSWDNWLCLPSNPNCNNDTDYRAICNEAYAPCRVSGGCNGGG